MNQIFECVYLDDPTKWERVAREQGGLEICNDDSGEPMYLIGC